MALTAGKGRDANKPGEGLGVRMGRKAGAERGEGIGWWREKGG